MPEDEPEEDWMRHLRDLGKSLDANLTPCPVCGEPLDSTDRRCKLCGHSVIAVVEPDEDEDFRLKLRSTLRTPEGAPAGGEDESPEDEMWEALDDLVREPRPEAPVEEVAEGGEVPRWTLGAAILALGLVVYGIPMAAGPGSIVGVAAMAVGSLLVVLGLNRLLSRVRFRIPRDVSLPPKVLPFLLLGVGLVGYTVSPGLLEDPVFVVPAMAMGALLIVLGVNWVTDLLAAPGSRA